MSILSNPNFVAWFGESKAVDGAGLPLILFHGGQKLTAWNSPGDEAKVYGGHAAAVKRAHGSMLSSTEIDHLDHPVFFFTDDESVAEGYADQGDNYEVRSHCLRLHNPLDLRLDNRSRAEIEALLISKLDGIAPSDFSLSYTQYAAEREISLLLRWDWVAVRKALEGHGYDGLIFADTNVLDRGRHMSYAVFQPNQIKCALRNNGLFSLDNPDIEDAVAKPEKKRVRMP